MSHITVHQATIFDLERLVPLFDAYRQFYQCDSDPYAAREFLRSRLNHGECALFIALDDGEPVGFAQLYPSFSSITLKRTFSMNDLYVQSAARRQGAALRLMSAAVDYASAIGAEKISLSIGLSNDAAQALYSSTGWELDDQFQAYYFMVPEVINAS